MSRSLFDGEKKAMYTKQKKTHILLGVFLAFGRTMTSVWSLCPAAGRCENGI